MFRPQTELPNMTAEHAQDCTAIGPFDSKSATSSASQESSPLCCVGCFRLMTMPETPLDASENSTDSLGPELLCASCFHHLSCKDYVMPESLSSRSGTLSPLPKLSLLVKAEAKCQDQLQLLQIQQQALEQQRESLQATERAKKEALVVERRLARRQRKHFFFIQECRKRGEELKFQQFLGDENTGRSEQEGVAGKKKPKPPKVKTHQSSFTSNEGSIYVSKPVRKHAEAVCTTRNDYPFSQATHRLERQEQMQACYSQDLSPLVEGRKPTRMPLSKPHDAVVTSVMTKRRQRHDTKAQGRKVASFEKKLRDQSLERKIVKLHPLGKERQTTKFYHQRQNSSNQFENSSRRKTNGTLCELEASLPVPSRRFVDHATPLTAAIKPVSWANGLLPQSDVKSDEICVDSSTSLQSVEEKHYSLQTIMFPSYHQLPNMSSPNMSSSANKQEILTDATSKEMRWEYSAERLSSLLEKYNVSVSTTASSPKL